MRTVSERAIARLVVLAIAAAIGSTTVAVRALTPEEEAKLWPADPRYDSYFGVAVALDGDTALVSRSGYISVPDCLSHAVYVFVRQGGSWNEQAKLLPSDAASCATDGFGAGIALDGDTAVIGTPWNQFSVYYAGRAWVFTREEDVWKERVMLTAADATQLLTPA